MKKPNCASLSRYCAYAAVGLGVLWMMLVTGSKSPTGGFKVFCDVLLVVWIAAALISMAVLGVAWGCGQWSAPKVWLLFKRIVFWSLLVASFVLGCTEVSLNKALGALLALVWMIWAVLALFVQLIAFAVSRVAKKKSLEGK